MLILEAGNIKKYYADRLVLEFDEMKIYTGDKIGIVGVNGSGKTTLLNILSGELKPDEGFVKKYCDIGYIRQFSEEEISADSKLLKEFSLSQKEHQQALSGGEKTRVKIANVFSKDRSLIFADEPTANLDYRGIELLRQKLYQTESFLLISHDRNLLESLCTRIIEIRDGKLKIYNGGYSFYREQYEKDQQRAWQDYNNYVWDRSKLEAAITDRQSRSKTMKKTPSRMGNSEARLHKREVHNKQQKLDSAANSMKTRLERLEVKEKPKELPNVRLDFSLTNPPENKIVIAVKDLTFSYEDRDIFKNTGFNVLNGLKTAVWGENGTGKSTLLNLISENLNENIYVAPKVKLGYFRQCFENLDYNKSVLENVLEDSVQSQTAARTILARLLVSGDDVYKNVGVLSGGEKIKVSFAKLFVSNANVLLLDEPTNFLDMKSIEALENVLKDYEGTVLFVSHDKTFVNSVAQRLLILKELAVTEFDGKLEDYMLSLKKSKSESKFEIERVALQMRITEIISLLSFSKSDKEKAALEAEYRQLLLQLRQADI